MTIDDYRDRKAPTTASTAPVSQTASRTAATRRDLTARRRGNALVLSIPTAITLIILVVSQAWIAGLPDEYTATSAVAFTPKITQNGSVPGSEVVNLGASKYLSVLESEATMAAVATAAGVSVTDLESATDAVIVPGTATLSISVSGSDPTQVSLAANANAAQVLTRAKGDTIVVADQVAQAVPPTIPSGPARTVLSVLTAAMAIVIGTVALVIGLTILRYFRTKPREEWVPAWLSTHSPATSEGAGERTENQR